MTRKIKVLGISLFALIIAALIVVPIVACTPQGNAYDKYYDIEFHRGGRGAMPENTLYAYTYAIEQGATTIEGDMQMTKDGVIVMAHSPFLEPDMAMDKNGQYVTQALDMRTMNYEEVKQYNVGHIKKNTEYFSKFGATQLEIDAYIPTLEELLQLVNDSGNKEIMLNLETKSYPDPGTGRYYTNNVPTDKFVSTIMDTIKKYKLENRVIIQSFDGSVFPIVKKLNSKILTSALGSDTPSEDQGIGTLGLKKKEASPWLAGYNIHDFGDNALDIAYALGCEIISPELDQVSTMQIIQAHDGGMRVVPWTVNTLDQMEKAGEMECDGFITDYGYLGREFLELHEASIPEPYEFDSKYHIELP